MSATNIPALVIPLHGKALIEASAGTGKTWTLTGILLRLLLEPHTDGSLRRPREIIATTFTRKAAAEMRQRMHKRLEQFLRLGEALSQAYQADNALLNDDAALAERLTALLDDWQHTAEPALQTAAQDAINRHLLTSAAAQGLDALIALLSRANQLSQSIDELYIGTLDGLCQRWLNEFALETGSHQQLELLEAAQEQDSVADLLHQHLRKMLAQMSEADLALWLGQNPSQSDYENLAEAINKSLNFADIPLEPLPDIQPRLAEIAAEQQALQQAADYQAAVQFFAALPEADIAEFAAWWQSLVQDAENYFVKDTAPAIKKLNFAVLLQTLKAQRQLSSSVLQALSLLVDSEQSHLGKRGEGKKAREKFYTHRIVQSLQTLIKAQTHREAERQTWLAVRIRHQALDYVRQHLPEYLERKGKITFSEKLARLNRALAGEQGKALAQYICHRYPVILVDESQDLNAAQAHLLEKLHFAHLSERAFLLLVGDPKQAIYRFRGGDVKNYLRLKQHFTAQECYVLSESFRSAPPLIAGLNALYAEHKTLSQGIEYETMRSAASAERRIVQANGQNITQPIHYYAVANSDEEIEQIVALVKQLRSPHSPYAYRQDDGSLSPIRGQDILILLRSHDKLQELQAALQREQIAVEYAEQSSVFAHSLTKEIGILLQAIDEPQQQNLIKRLLSGILFGYSQNEITAMLAAEHPLFAKLRRALQKANQQWQQQQVLSAMQTLLSEPLNRGISIWEHLASFPSPERERYLLDLRQLQQIVADYGSKMPPAQFLHWWQQALANPPLQAWAQAMPLPSQDALRLMTIHKAKGLEAPLVIVGGLGSPKAESDLIYPYQQQLSALPKDDARKEALKQERDEELARLLYVALTRPADLLFVGMVKKTNYAFPALKPLQPVDRNLPHSQILHAGLPAATTHLSAPETRAPHKNLGESYANTAFSGWQKSSFSALARQLDTEAQETALDLPDYAYAEIEAAAPLETAEQAFQLNFAKGTEAGSFLHGVLEELEAKKLSNYRHIIERYTRRYLWHIAKEPKMLQQWIANPDLRQWIEHIVQSPLISGTNLADIAPPQRVNEMAFIISSRQDSPMPFAAINQLLATWGKKLRLTERKSIIGFLKGEIDLCYEYQGRYYILDYKSNYLGSQAQDYRLAALTQAMDEHAYWLQALIYQTALHRWLQQRLPNYQAEQHLGTVEYFFLRGCGLGEHNGHLAVDIPLEILYAFDRLLC